MASQLTIAETSLNHRRTIAEPTESDAQTEGGLVEAVQATASDLAKLPFDGMAEGLYQVGTGNTGAAAALVVSGAAMTSIMLASAFRWTTIIKLRWVLVGCASSVPVVGWVSI